MIQCNVQVMELSLQVKSMEEAPMEISDDEQEEALMKLNEDELDSIQVIESMWISSKDVLRFDIPLCRMLYMPLV